MDSKILTYMICVTILIVLFEYIEGKIFKGATSYSCSIYKIDFYLIYNYFRLIYREDVRPSRETFVIDSSPFTLTLYNIGIFFNA